MARVPCEPTVRKPDPSYYCEEGGQPRSVPAFVVDGSLVFQAPLHYCGNHEPVCEDGLVSGCISDTDGAPTAYGPAPADPDPSRVGGPSPRFSRVRVNRGATPAPLPYSTTKYPDQLIDIVDSDGEPIQYDPVTGRFTLPAGVVNWPDGPWGCGLGWDAVNGELIVSPDYNVSEDGDIQTGNSTVLDSGDGMVTRLAIHNVITNTSCRDQFVHSVNAKGFGVTPVTPSAQIRYGVYNVTQSAVVQVSQSPTFTAGWQHKDTYFYPSLNTPLAPGASRGDQLALFVEVLSGEVIWVDADFSNTMWYGK